MLNTATPKWRARSAPYACSIELGNAINSGQGVGLAALNVVIDAIAVASPAPGISEAAHVIEGAVKVGEGAKAIESAKAIETGSSKAAESEAQTTYQTYTKKS